MLSSSSLHSRFLVAPIVAVVLLTIMFFASRNIVESNTNLLESLHNSDLVQISLISQINAELSNNNSKLVKMLLESNGLDEEEIYERGKEISDELYQLQANFTALFSANKDLTINGQPIFSQINDAFSAYRLDAITAIEMATVEPQQALYELKLASKQMSKLTKLFLTLSEFYVTEMKANAANIQDGLNDKTYITQLGVLMIILMIGSAFYFSTNLANKLTAVYHTLSELAKGKNIAIEKDEFQEDPYIHKLWQIVFTFSKMIEQDTEQKNKLLAQKSAMDSHSIIAMTDLDGTITYVNDKFCHISGYCESELIGANHRKLNSGNQPKSYWTEMFSQVSQGKIWHDEVLNRAKNGDKYWVDTTIIPLKSVIDDTVYGYLSIRTDISEAKRQTENLIEAKLKAETATQAKSQFLATMSHEIRTPMNGVIGLTQLLKNTELTELQRDYVDKVLLSGHGLLTIINDILDFSKIESSALTLELIPFNLSAICQECINVLDAEAKRKSLTIKFQFPTNQPANFIGDPNRLKQIIVNLMGNAVKFTSHGHVTLRVSLNVLNAQTSQVKIEVEDTGIGLTKDAQSHVFSEFSQADNTTTRNFGGTGLGLAISQKLVQLMGGEIGVNSLIDQGSTFWFTLPLEISRQELKDDKVMVEVEKNFSGRILLVEDNKINQLVATKMLKALGLSVHLEEDGSAACEAFKEHEFDLVFMDCHMPIMDGYQASKVIREHETTHGISKTPIVALTANVSAEDREKCLHAGMDEMVSKPFLQSDIAACLAEWLDKNE